MLTSEGLAAVLRSHGYKVTPQRLAVYEALANEKWHPSAEALYKKMLPGYPAMSFATVYKILDILHKIGVIQVLNTGEDSFRYEAETVEHSHMQCTECGTVRDIMSLDASKVRSTVAAETGFEVTGQQFYFFGICPECQKKRAAGAVK